MRGSRPRSGAPYPTPEQPEPWLTFTMTNRQVGTRPIVFLDVDGVLCCNHETRLEAAPCAELQRIAESTRAAVVLSTDWRRDPSLSSRIKHVLHERRVDCIGATPQLSGSMDRVSRVRPKEILSWLSEHGLGGLHGSTNWVAIDDRDLVSEDGGEALRGRFVQTAFASGLTRELADRPSQCFCTAHSPARRRRGHPTCERCRICSPRPAWTRR
mmetsp:Transcript_48262/g.157955  ORF Transcript_48262/g.157955 Transcript_48262/m.157955 type:complete len:213 (+) Transcript_48262:216-854(+)